MSPNYIGNKLATAIAKKATVKLDETVKGYALHLIGPELRRKLIEGDIACIEEMGSAMAKVSKETGATIEYEKFGIKITTDADLIERAQLCNADDLVRRQINKENVVKEALLSLSENPDAVSDDPVDPDWTARFFDNVADVSNENMQSLWAKLLAGEVIRPGSHSLRSLEALRVMSQAEAELFQKVAQAFIGFRELMIPQLNPFDDFLQERFGITHMDILDCIGMGLVTAPTSGWSIKGERGPGYIIHGTRALIVTPKNKRVTESYSVRLLTRAGWDLWRLLEVESDDDYLFFIGKQFKSRGNICEFADMTAYDKYAKTGTYDIHVGEFERRWQGEAGTDGP